MHFIAIKKYSYTPMHFKKFSTLLSTIFTLHVMEQHLKMLLFVPFFFCAALEFRALVDIFLTKF